LRRARRRTIGLTIDHRGLRVGAPPRASLREVESLILQHGEWVGRKLDEWRTRRQPEPLQIVDGVQLPMLGRPLTIRLALGGNRCVWNLQAEPSRR
jgi:predicted metal-dependent hydrolase